MTGQRLHGLCHLVGTETVHDYFTYLQQVYRVDSYIGSMSAGTSSLQESRSGVAFVTPVLDDQERELRSKIWQAIGSPQGEFIEVAECDKPLDQSLDRFEFVLVFGSLNSLTENSHQFQSLKQITVSPEIKRDVWERLKKLRISSSR